MKRFLVSRSFLSLSIKKYYQEIKVILFCPQTKNEQYWVLWARVVIARFKKVWGSKGLPDDDKLEYSTKRLKSSNEEMTFFAIKAPKRLTETNQCNLKRWAYWKCLSFRWSVSFLTFTYYFQISNFHKYIWLLSLWFDKNRYIHTANIREYSRSMLDCMKVLLTPF